MIRELPDSFDAEVVTEIDRRLASVETSHGVLIPWAVESGSRAWGFPSPDSDYDCRFFYVRPRSGYLSLWPRRDVIETPLDPIFDVNGWDIAKALRLLAKGNATIVEWLSSPIVYAGDPTFRDGLLALAEEALDPVAVARHYLHVADIQGADAAAGDIKLKRVFYALRPALALRWMRMHAGSGAPPMNLRLLIESTDLRPELVEQIDELIELKSHTRELGTGPFPPALRSAISQEVELARGGLIDAAPTHPSARQGDIDAYFRQLIGEDAG